MKKKRIMVEHGGHKILLQPGADKQIKYSMFKYVNGEQFAIASTYPADNDNNRGMFVDEALRGFERARAAPFN